MCKYAKIQKNLVEGLKNSILYETEQISKSHKSGNIDDVPVWHVDNIGNLHFALGGAGKKRLYENLHDISSNYTCGFIDKGTFMIQLYETCVYHGGHDLFSALMELPEINKQYTNFVRAAVKMFDADSSEFELFLKKLESE